MRISASLVQPFAKRDEVNQRSYNPRILGRKEAFDEHGINHFNLFWRGVVHGKVANVSVSLEMSNAKKISHIS